ncbi:hypothetical protein [Pseudomonas syringae]|uniref:hypothetical protein n=1 Tax=Pseudomonas syringae TaxID=317 RepID=UPI001F0D7AB2|nr:hypothetical protein [Pseudomonas syringae]MCH5486749.1 hypothetical protein [Pseudomonas syringae pv. syringae]MDO1457677.1 hypothetical protein [Pseudomonas syringae pv. syringae]
MSAYDEIRSRYASYEAAATLQLQLLSKAAVGLVNGFEKYLDLPQARLPNNDDGGLGQRYVRFGVGAPAEFEEKNWHALSSRGGVVDFSFAITLDEPATHSRAVIVFENSVQFVDHGYEFKIKGVDTFTVGAADAVNNRFEAIYKALVDQLLNLYNSERIVIKR